MYIATVPSYVYKFVFESFVACVLFSYSQFKEFLKYPNYNQQLGMHHVKINSKQLLVLC